jgi:glycosyltransferase involved in cell wall biosynthesis
LEKDFGFKNFGLLNPSEVSRLFNESDIFVDFSVFQAMGLTAMEAMASGLAVVVPEKGGAGSFARNRQNSIVVDTTDASQCEKALFELIENHVLRENISREAIKNMPHFNSDLVAAKILNILFG